jgi:thiosulfate/3-mercaptopyruvate sulfurtransferase
MSETSLGRRAFMAAFAAGTFRGSGLRASQESKAENDPWSPTELVEPDRLAERIAAKEKLTVLYVGFPVLYRAGHIPGATMAGPASKPEGMELLKEATQDLDRNKEVILYCGCCPFTQCPNIRPAYSDLKSRGFTHVRVVRIPTNLHTDWTSKGYPINRPPVEPATKSNS